MGAQRDAPTTPGGRRLTTLFAPPDRATADEVTVQSQLLRSDPLVLEVLEALPSMVLILNGQRQAILANRSVIEWAGENRDSVLGQRPGEIFQCVHSGEEPGGCGTAEACRYCGVVHVILAALKGTAAEEDARLTLEDGTPLDLRAEAHPIRVGGEDFVVLTLSDVADEKRRRALERTFFHDVLNTAGGVQGLVQMLDDAAPTEQPMLVRMLAESARRMVGEIRAQRVLLAAEAGEYTLSPCTVRPGHLLRRMVDQYRKLAADRGVRIQAAAEATNDCMLTDEVLLARVLGNLTKNALEASVRGGGVTLDARHEGDAVEFHVHNAGEIPRKAQLQIFQRSFSTKGPDRGLGTYSVKLFTERYLGGEVGFESTAETGTTFTVRVPCRH